MVPLMPPGSHDEIQGSRASGSTFNGDRGWVSSCCNPPTAQGQHLAGAQEQLWGSLQDPDTGKHPGLPKAFSTTQAPPAPPLSPTMNTPPYFQPPGAAGAPFASGCKEGREFDLQILFQFLIEN